MQDNADKYVNLDDYIHTSDLSITNGFTSVLCHPAVKGANIPWFLNLQCVYIYIFIQLTTHINSKLHI